MNNFLAFLSTFVIIFGTIKSLECGSGIDQSVDKARNVMICKGEVCEQRILDGNIINRTTDNKFQMGIIAGMKILNQINGTFIVHIGKIEMYSGPAVASSITIISGRKEPYIIQHNGIQWLKVSNVDDIDPNFMMCKQNDKFNFTCETEGGDIIKSNADNLTKTFQDYLKNIDHFIKTKNFIVGIRVGSENLILNLEQAYRPKVKNTTAPVFNSANQKNRIENVNGVLTISLGQTKRYREPVSGSIEISYLDAKPYIQLNGEDIMKVPNVIICRLDQKNFICEREKGYTTKTTSELEMIIKDYLNDTVDHYLITPDLVIGIRSGNETLTINIEQGEEPRVKNITGIMFNSRKDEKQILLDYLDGFVIITLGKTEIFRGPVSWYIAMISSKDAQPCLIQHNAKLITMETNKTVINEDSNYQNESIIICKRSKPYNSNNNTCKTENGAIIITSGNIATVKEHFKNTNILIQVKESTKPGRSNGTIYTKELRNVNGSLTISIGNKTFREQILEFLHISSNDKEAKYLVQQNGVDMNDLIRDIIICKRDSVNITCKTENDTITVIEENIWNTFNEYLNYLEYYIKSSNLWIGIRLVKGNLTLNLVQDLKLNVSERIFDYTEEGGSIEIDKGWISVNGTLILTFDNKTISEHVTGNLTIKSLKETQKNYVLQHNGVDVNKLQEK